MAKTLSVKGVVKLNPTKMIMKSGTEQYRKAVTSNVKSFKKVKPPKAIKGKTK